MNVQLVPEGIVQVPAQFPVADWLRWPDAERFMNAPAAGIVLPLGPGEAQVLPEKLGCI